MVDLSVLLGLIERLSSRMDDEVDGLSNAIDALSNDFGVHIGALSNDFGSHISALSNDFGAHIGALSNNFGSHIGELEVGFGALETWSAAADPKIQILQEFNLVFYDDLRIYTTRSTPWRRLHRMPAPRSRTT